MATVDCTTPISSLGSTYIRGLDVYSNRRQGNARIENVDFAFEVARQESVRARSGVSSWMPDTHSPTYRGNRL